MTKSVNRESGKPTAVPGRCSGEENGVDLLARGCGILFDQGTPHPLKQHFSGYQVETAYELGWSRLSNGALCFLTAAEGRFDVLVTTDRNLRHQQSLSGRKLAKTTRPRTLKAGDYLELTA
jgi:hypothetical protein